MKLKKWDRNPILRPTGKGYWEKVAVLNPGAWYENGIVYLLYRASGEFDDYRIYFGLAISKDGFNFERVSDEPVLKPSKKGFDAGCVEDPRIVKFGNMFYVTYACRAYPPGAFFNKGKRPDYPKGASRSLIENLSRSGLLISKDLHKFKRLGPITRDDIDDRDVVLFPEKIGNKYVMLHRPQEQLGKGYGGCDKPSIWLMYSDDLLHWTDDYLLAEPEYDWEEAKIGAGPPPLKTDKGWLVIYHGVDNKNIYRVGVMMLDLNNPKKIIARSPYFIMEPEAEFEKVGFVPNVVFPCGNVVIGDTLFVYYGGADMVCCVATIELREIIDYVMKFKV